MEEIYCVKKDENKLVIIVNSYVEVMGMKMKILQGMRCVVSVKDEWGVCVLNIQFADKSNAAILDDDPYVAMSNH